MAGNGWACFSGKPSVRLEAGEYFCPAQGGDPLHVMEKNSTDLSGHLLRGFYTVRPPQTLSHSSHQSSKISLIHHFTDGKIENQRG